MLLAGDGKGGGAAEAKTAGETAGICFSDASFRLKSFRSPVLFLKTHRLIKYQKRGHFDSS